MIEIDQQKLLDDGIKMVFFSRNIHTRFKNFVKKNV